MMVIFFSDKAKWSKSAGFDTSCNKQQSYDPRLSKMCQEGAGCTCKGGLIPRANRSGYEVLVGWAPGHIIIISYFLWVRIPALIPREHLVPTYLSTNIDMCRVAGGITEDNLCPWGKRRRDFVSGATRHAETKGLVHNSPHLLSI